MTLIENDWTNSSNGVHETKRAATVSEFETQELDIPLA
jgi:hypothetical protein